MSEWKKVRLGEIANYVNEKIDIKAFDTSCTLVQTPC